MAVASVASIDDPLWTATRLADTLALDMRLVRQALEPLPSRDLNGRRAWLLRDAAPAIFRWVWKLDRAESNPDLMSPKDRLDHYRAERERVKLAQETRTLLPAADVEQAISEMLKVLAQALSSLPDSLERECGLNAATVGALHRQIDAARETLFAAVSNLTLAEPHGETEPQEMDA